MPAPFRLGRGDLGPQQQTPVSCGAACLTVARMLLDPAFAAWVTTGEGVPPDGVEVPGAGSPTARFAAYEVVVHRRTNATSLTGPGLGMPWPRGLGTPPWGARRELERTAARRGTGYAVELLRGGSAGQLREDYRRLTAAVADGAPALLYVGNATLPRHVVLVLPGDGDLVLDVYEPASGLVRVVTAEEMERARLGLGGWQVPWISVQATPERPARLHALRRALTPARAVAPEAGLARVDEPLSPGVGAR